MGRSDVPALRLDSPERYRVPRSGSRAIYTSPLQRARTSVAVLFDGEEGIVDVRLSERGVGEWEGLDHATVSRRWPEAFRRGSIDPFVTPPGGESMKQLQDRVADFLLTVVVASRDPLYVVTHNGWIRTALLLNGDVALDELFAEPVPFLQPIPFRLDVERVTAERPFDVR